jgi:hypothetical protein
VLFTAIALFDGLRVLFTTPTWVSEIRQTGYLTVFRIVWGVCLLIWIAIVTRLIPQA